MDFGELETTGGVSGADVVLDGSPGVRTDDCETAGGVRGNGGSGGGPSGTSPGGGPRVREILR